MKKLVDTDVVLIISPRCRFVAPLSMQPPSPQSRKSALGPRPFPVVSAFSLSTDPWPVRATFTLANGITYDYDYTGYGDFQASNRVASLLNHVMPDGPGEQSGGILFNASVRARCIFKKQV